MSVLTDLSIKRQTCESNLNDITANILDGTNNNIVTI